MTKTVFQLRLSVQELERWKRLSPGPVSAWVKGLVNEECDSLEAEERFGDQARQERIEQLESIAPGLQRAVSVGGRKPFRPDFK